MLLTTTPSESSPVWGYRWGGILLLIIIGTSTAAAADWKQITYEDGIRVSRKEVAGRDLPIFRGVTTYDSNIYDILTILDHIPSHTEWVHRCAESRVVKRISHFQRLVYNRTDAPWPVADRDMVVRTAAKVDTKAGTVTISFTAIPGHVAPKDDVVRIKRLHGSYFLEILAEERTRVTYQIDSDPGGWLPRWLIKMASKQLPLHTLGNLRKRIRKMKGTKGREGRRALWVARLKEETGQTVPTPPSQAAPAP